MMNNRDESLTAVDVIRCVYLARAAANRGDYQAAQRLQAKADTWLERTRAAPRDIVGTTTTLRTVQ
jgi:hypothetical protein